MKKRHFFKIFFRILSAVCFLFILSCSSQDRVWVYKDPIQCLGNPWEQAWLAAHNDDWGLWHDLSDADQLQVFVKYYGDVGIEIHQYRQTFPYEFTCEACDCPRGDRIHCLINNNDVAKMVAWGFSLDIVIGKW